MSLPESRFKCNVIRQAATHTTNRNETFTDRTIVPENMSIKRKCLYFLMHLEEIFLR